MPALPRPRNLPPAALNANAELVLRKRYFLRDPEGEILEDAQDMFWRVASAIAAEETKYAASPWKAPDLALAFYSLMAEGRFLPNSPTLMNAGADLGQL
jgi:ribonucleoside-diphosphate reductase alpha chain